MEIVERTHKPKPKAPPPTPVKEECVKQEPDNACGVKGVTQKATLKMASVAKDTGTAVKTLFTRRKKLVIVSCMLALLCVTVYLNFSLNSDQTIQTGSRYVETNRFVLFRNDRADQRARDILVYENIAATTADAALKASAQSRLAEIRANVAFETTAEGLILSDGYADVIVQRTNGFVNVILKRDTNIDRTQAIKIMSVLQSIDSSLDIDNVHISLWR